MNDIPHAHDQLSKRFCCREITTVCIHYVQIKIYLPDMVTSACNMCVPLSNEMERLYRRCQARVKFYVNGKHKTNSGWYMAIKGRQCLVRAIKGLQMLY